MALNTLPSIRATYVRRLNLLPKMPPKGIFSWVGTLNDQHGIGWLFLILLIMGVFICGVNTILRTIIDIVSRNTNPPLVQPLRQ